MEDYPSPPTQHPNGRLLRDCPSPSSSSSPPGTRRTSPLLRPLLLRRSNGTRSSTSPLTSLSLSFLRTEAGEKEFRRVLDNLPSPSMHEPIRVQYQRGQLVEATHARLLRLHRPFLSRGYTPGSPYRYSTEQCTSSLPPLALALVGREFDRGWMMNRCQVS
jgi:hypothetical protein